MINKETIERIIEASRIEEVVGDYVNLKKRGANLLGLCPFHNEKTPSFTVSPVKGIYKCFGCGKAGNSVNFVMEHEHFSYPEALKFLARKYNIEVEEDQREYSPEEVQEQNEKESLFVISSHAQKFFSEQLWDTEEGRNIGLSYFKERGFSEETIQKFQLGYSPDGWSTYSTQALKEGFKAEHLEQSGLGIQRDGKWFDRFHGRVMFPIHSLSGRVLGFGARTLSADKKTAKYLNSPESPIYHKSNVLYGIWHARKAISSKDNCFLVEGYTDVISFSQAGIENVVASSGTSLTQGQIRLIKRYTPNVTILYDGDPAGIKASLRGINMLLEEGLQVKVALFPDGEDPDSYARKHGKDDTLAFLNDASTDFIVFKSKLLLEETGKDPLKRAGVIRDIVESIALVPDAIARNIYVKECSALFEMEESSILHELNKMRRNLLDKKSRERPEAPLPDLPPGDVGEEDEHELTQEEKSLLEEERELIRILLLHGNKEIADPESEGEEPELIKVATLVSLELTTDEITFTEPVHQKIYEAFQIRVDSGEYPELHHFVHHEDPQVAKASIDSTSTPHALSPGWQKHQITVSDEDADLSRLVTGTLFSLRIRHIGKLIEQRRKKLRLEMSEEELITILTEIKALEEAKKMISATLGRIVLR